MAGYWEHWKDGAREEWDDSEEEERTIWQRQRHELEMIEYARIEELVNRLMPVTLRSYADA